MAQLPVRCHLPSFGHMSVFFSGSVRSKYRCPRHLLSEAERCKRCVLLWLPCTHYLDAMLLRSCRALTHYLDATLIRSSLALTHYLDTMLQRSRGALTHYLDATLTRSSLALTHHLDAMLLCSHVVMLACSHAQRAGTGGAQDGRKISRLKRACTHTCILSRRLENHRAPCPPATWFQSFLFARDDDPQWEIFVQLKTKQTLCKIHSPQLFSLSQVFEDTETPVTSASTTASTTSTSTVATVATTEVGTTLSGVVTTQPETTVVTSTVGPSTTPFYGPNLAACRRFEISTKYIQVHPSTKFLVAFRDYPKLQW